jgi:hypothetical protein
MAIPFPPLILYLASKLAITAALWHSKYIKMLADDALSAEIDA